MSRGGSADPQTPREPCERLFFALWPDEPQRSVLAQATAQAVRHCGGRPVALDSLHVTLVFLGAVPVRRLPDLRVIGHQISLALIESFTLTFDRLEHWPKPQVLCAAGTAPSPGVTHLARTLGKRAAEAGFSPDPKPFREHVTVVRKVGHPTNAGPIDPVQWTMPGFALMSSRTDSRGPLYSVVESYPLDGRRPP